MYAYTSPSAEQRERWRIERENEQRAMLERLERGNKPRNDSETCIAFVRGWENGRHESGYPGNVSIRIPWDNGPVQLVSYATPVAFRDGMDILVSEVRYSTSTTQQLGKLSSALLDAGYDRDSTRVRLAPHNVRGGYLNRHIAPFVVWTKDGTGRDSSDPVHGGVWVSPNGIWSITRNADDIGNQAIPFIVRNHGYAVAYVLTNVEYPHTDQPRDTFVRVVSGKLPAYVRTAALELVGAS